jgi:hypothetical protein
MLPLRGMRVKHAVQRGNLGTDSAFPLGPRKTTENLDRVGWSQGLPDANGLLAISPALNTRTLTSAPICAVTSFEKKKFTYFFLQISLFMFTLRMSAEQLCISFAKKIHSYTYIDTYICDYRSIGEFEYLLRWGGGVRILYEVCCSSNNRDCMLQFISASPVPHYCPV